MIYISNLIKLFISLTILSIISGCYSAEITLLNEENSNIDMNILAFQLIADENNIILNDQPIIKVSKVGDSKFIRLEKTDANNNSNANYVLIKQIKENNFIIQYYPDNLSSSELKKYNGNVLFGAFSVDGDLIKFYNFSKNENFKFKNIDNLVLSISHAILNSRPDLYYKILKTK